MSCRRHFMKIGVFLACSLTIAITAFAAYHHSGDTDSDVVLAVYPDIAGTKLDSCALCHSGGQYEKKPGAWVTLGSCQWCHYEYGYDASGDINLTLNPYGKDYRDNGRNENALISIEDLDSDEDGFSNIEEIAALRFPGNDLDDPSKVTAPYRIYSRDELEGMKQHTQFMLMNTHKSGDFYAEYTGIPLEDLLEDAGMLPSATGIMVYAPDGWAQYHPLDPDPDPLFYHIRGAYPQASFYYDEEADELLTSYGWCNYEAPSCDGYQDGDSIENENGLKAILAFKRDGEYLETGQLGSDNKLDGEGPFRVVPPQKTPGPPDQSSNASNQDVIWPFDEDADHNAGFSSRTVTMIKIEPLPEGTTDLDIQEAGWNFVDENKVIVYGAINPVPMIKEKLTEMIGIIDLLDKQFFKSPALKRVLTTKIVIARSLIDMGFFKAGLKKLTEDIMPKLNGCIEGDSPDKNDLVTSCESQKELYWLIHEVKVLLEGFMTIE